MKEKGGKQHIYPFFGSILNCWDIFEKEGTSEKGCVEIEDWGTSVHLVLGFQENSMQSISQSIISFWLTQVTIKLFTIL